MTIANDIQKMKNLLIELNACKEAREWAGDKTAEQIINECYRGDWLLWLAQRVDVDFQLLTLAKGKCANTVRHLMKDERSIKAVDTAIAFGEGKADRNELAAAANAAAYTAAYAASDAASDAAYAAYTAANAAAYAAYAAYAAAYTAYAAAYAAYAAYADTRKETQLQMANICREVFAKELLQIIKQKLS
jgi:hypothetical protein